MAMQFLSLEAVVNILTGQAIKQLDGIKKEADKSGGGISRSFNLASVAVQRFAGPAVLGALTGIIAKIAADATSMGFVLIDAFKKIEAQTGITADEADRLKKSYMDIWRGGAEESDRIVAALKAVRREAGDLGDQTEEVTDRFLKFTKVTGEDVDRTVESTLRTMATYGVEMQDLGEFTDRFAAIQQKTGDSTLELLDSLNQGAALFKTFGLDAKEAGVLMGFMRDNGIDLATSMASLKQLLDATKSPTVEQTRAFEQLGIATDEAGKPLADLPSIFQHLIAISPNVTGNNEKLGAAMEILGSRSAPKMVQGFAAGSEALADLSKAADNAAGTVEKGSAKMEEAVGERLTRVWRDSTGEGIEYFAGKFAEFMEWFLTQVEYAVQALKMFAAQIGAYSADFSSKWQAVLDSAEARLAEFAQAVLRTFLGIAESVQGVLDQIVAHSDSWGGIYGPLAEGARSGSAAIDQLREKALALDKSLEGKQKGVLSFSNAWKALMTLPGAEEAMALVGGTSDGGAAGQGGKFDARKQDAKKTPSPGTGGATGGAGGAGKSGLDPADLNFQLAAAEKRIALQKSTARDELAAAEAVLEAGRKRKLIAADLQALEEKVFALRQKAHQEEITEMEMVYRKKVALGQAGAADEIKMIEAVLQKDLVSGEARIAKEVELAEKRAALTRAREDLQRKIDAVSQSTTQQRIAALRAEDADLKKAGIDEYQRNAYRATQERQIREDQRKFEAGIEGEILTAIGDETGARLLALQTQYEEHKKNATDKAQIDRWYSAQVKSVLEQEARAHDALRVEVLRIVKGEREARLAELELQYQDLKKTRKDQLAVEDWYKAQKAQIDQQQADATRSVTTKTAQIQGKAREVTLRGIEDEVRAMREGGAEEVAVLEYIEARRKEFFEAERGRKSQEGQFDFTTGGITVANSAEGIAAALSSSSSGGSRLGEGGFFSKKDASLSEAESRFNKLKKKPVKTDAEGNPLETPAESGASSAEAGSAIEGAGAAAAAEVKNSGIGKKEGDKTGPEAAGVAVPDHAPISMSVEVKVGGSIEMIEATGDLDKATLGGLFGAVNFFQHLQGTKPTRSGRQ